MPHQIWKTINRNLCSSFFSIFKEQFFSSLLALSIFRSTKPSSKCSLNRRRQHDRCFILMLLQGIQEIRSKSKVTVHEIFWILRSVHTSEIEYKITLLAELFQFFLCVFQIVFIYFFNFYIRTSLITSILYGAKIVNQSCTNHSFSTSN